MTERISRRFILSAFSRRKEGAFSRGLTGSITTTFSGPRIGMCNIRSSNVLFKCVTIDEGFRVSRLCMVTDRRERKLNDVLVGFVRRRTGGLKRAQVAIGTSLGTIPFCGGYNFRAASSIRRMLKIEFRPVRGVI